MNTITGLSDSPIYRQSQLVLPFTVAYWNICSPIFATLEGSNKPSRWSQWRLLWISSIFTEDCDGEYLFVCERQQRGLLEQCASYLTKALLIHTRASALFIWPLDRVLYGRFMCCKVRENESIWWVRPESIKTDKHVINSLNQTFESIVLFLSTCYLSHCSPLWCDSSLLGPVIFTWKAIVTEKVRFMHQFSPSV